MESIVSSEQIPEPKDITHEFLTMEVHEFNSMIKRSKEPHLLIDISADRVLDDSQEPISFRRLKSFAEKSQPSKNIEREARISGTREELEQVKDKYRNETASGICLFDTDIQECI